MPGATVAIVMAEARRRLSRAAAGRFAVDLPAVTAELARIQEDLAGAIETAQQRGWTQEDRQSALAFGRELRQAERIHRHAESFEEGWARLLADAGGDVAPGYQAAPNYQGIVRTIGAAGRIAVRG